MTPVPRNDSDVSTCPGQTVSLAEATAELRDARLALDAALSYWWTLTPEEVGAIAERVWFAHRDFRAAITEPERAS